MEYVELHSHSNFSFLDGAIHPENLAEHAARLGYRAFALTDHNGLYGIVRFNHAAKLTGVKPIFGTEITLDNNHHLTLIVRNSEGYSNLSRLLTTSNLRSRKGETKIDEAELRAHTEGLIALSGCRHGEIPSRILEEKAKEAEDAASKYRELFGSDNFFLELQHHNLPAHEILCEKLARIGKRLNIPIVATNNVHFEKPEGRRLQDILTCIKHHTNLDKANGILYPNSERYLKPPERMIQRFSEYPDAIENSAAVAARCDFKLDKLKTSLPDFPVPNGETTFSFLKELTCEGAKERYGDLTSKVVKQIEHELRIIGKLDLSGYFLIVWDIARFCKENAILCQGRGSAANSAVCYCLGVTAVDPIGLKLLFERFVSEERREAPDIDIDIANNRREEVIQYVYNKYSREHASMVCEVISYRGRSAVRDVGKALGFSLDDINGLTKMMDHFSRGDELEDCLREANLNLDYGRVKLLIELVQKIRRFPRHLGIHVGGMIITKMPLSHIVPIENATMPDRSVIGWDKDDVEDVGMVKIDILGLGMLSMIDIALKLIKEHRGIDIDLAKLPYDDPKVYDLLCDADTVGVFQVESRAQMNTLPRLRPRCFYDIVVEVALIRPGPIQGEMVHPYLRRRNGEEAITYPHPSLEPILKRTLGVPLFQEQSMQIAIAAAEFTPGQADALRRAMGHKRSHERMEAISMSLIEGMVRNGIDEETAFRIYKQMSAFADYGFPESHAASFALLVYVSSYLKLYYPQEFYCALLNAQPMGFYSPSSIIYEARRKGITILNVDVSKSLWDCTIEDGQIRLGFRYAKRLGKSAKDIIERELQKGRFTSIEDFVFRTNLNQGALEQLAMIDAFRSFGLRRREAMWHVMSIANRSQEELPIEIGDNGRKRLKPMATFETLVADFKGMNLSTGTHPMGLVRPLLRKRGILSSSDLKKSRSNTIVTVAGAVIIRQRPLTAKGFIFVTLEDETGFVNVVVKPDMARNNKRTIVSSSVLLVRGKIEKKNGVINVIGREFMPLQFRTSELQISSRDFR